MILGRYPKALILILVNYGVTEKQGCLLLDINTRKYCCCFLKNYDTDGDTENNLV